MGRGEGGYPPPPSSDSLPCPAYVASQIKFVHRWYPELVPQLPLMLPRSPWGRWLHQHLQQRCQSDAQDLEPKEDDANPRGCLFLRRSSMAYLLRCHKYTGAAFRDVGSHYTTPQHVLAITTMVFTVGLLVCPHDRQAGQGACVRPVCPAFVPPPPCISYALVQATVGVGTVIIVYVI